MLDCSIFKDVRSTATQWAQVYLTIRVTSSDQKKVAKQKSQ